MEVSVLVLLTLCLDWVWEVSCTPWSLYPKQKTSDRCFKGGCIGPRADIEVLEVGQFISSPGIKRRFLGRPAFSLIITPNELPRFTLRSQMAQKIRHILWWFPTRFTSCSAVTATHSHRPLTAETQVLFQAVPCAGVCLCVCGARARGPGDTGTDFSPTGGSPVVVILPITPIIFHSFTTDAL